MDIKKILCKIFGHKYYVFAKPAESWGNGIRWIKCSRCGADFAVNDRVKTLLPMDFEIKDMHAWKKIKSTIRKGKK